MRSFILIFEGTYPDRVSEELMQASDVLSPKRAEAVKNAMRHCWNGYKQHAWGYDELKPQSGRGQNNWGGMGVTLLDSLDTLWLMGLRAEFDEATEWIESHLNFNIGKTVSVFETTIRSLGGLLTAYDLSGKKIFLDKAIDLGKRLFRAFDSPSGIPVGQINLATGAGHNAAWTSSSSILAEIGTLQVEFRYLAEVSGNPQMFTKSTQVFKTVKNNNAMSDGLAPIYVSPQSGRFTTGRVTFGALGDSWYEYLLKCWIQGGKTEDWLREMVRNWKKLFVFLLMLQNTNIFTFSLTTLIFIFIYFFSSSSFFHFSIFISFTCCLILSSYVNINNTLFIIHIFWFKNNSTTML